METKMEKEVASIVASIGNPSMSSGRESLYEVTWSNIGRWNPQCISRDNVLDYFSDRSNPFYDSQCNNEYLRMQRLGVEHLLNMQGLEYALHTAQEPILYTIVKQRRLSATQVTPMAMYYVISGVVYQAPDMPCLINSRLLSATHYINSAFEEVLALAKTTNANTGVSSWDVGSAASGGGGSVGSGSIAGTGTTGDSSSGAKVDYRAQCALPEVRRSTAFQRQRVDQLLLRWSEQFPPPNFQLAIPGPADANSANNAPSAQPAGASVAPPTPSGSVAASNSGSAAPGPSGKRPTAATTGALTPITPAQTPGTSGEDPKRMKMG